MHTYLDKNQIIKIFFMTHIRTLALSAAMVLAFAIATPANAQFGNLMNKAKKAVKEKVDNTLKDSKQKEEGTGTFSIMARMKHPTKEKVSYK